MRGAPPAVVAASLLLAGAALLLASCAQPGPRGGAGAPGNPALNVQEQPRAAVDARIRSREAWSFNGSPGEILRTTHFRVYTTLPAQAVVRDRAVVFLEHALIRYRTAYGDLPAPRQKLDVYLMASRDQWLAVSQQLLGERAEHMTRILRGGFATGGVGVYRDLGLYDTLAIAAHEGWHQYVQRVFVNPLPVYLDEGIATTMEAHAWGPSGPAFTPWANLERFDRLRDAVSGQRLIPLGELLSTPPAEVVGFATGLDYYAQVWALVHFLEHGEGGRHREAFHRLIGDVASGAYAERLARAFGRRPAGVLLARRVGAEPLELYLGVPLDVLEPSYRSFVVALTAPGTRDRIVAGESPFPSAAPERP